MGTSSEVWPAECGIRNYPSPQPSPSRGEGEQNVFSSLGGEDQGEGEHGNTVALVQITDRNEKELARARNAAYRCLTYRPRSSAEIEAKLRDKGFDEAVIHTTLASLTRLGYLDDEKFARLWAESRVRLRAFGRRRIDRELREKGIDPSIVREALDVVFNVDQEIDIAEKAAARKVKGMQFLDRETRRRRLAGFLERKGFPYDVIRDVLKKTE